MITMTDAGYIQVSFLTNVPTLETLKAVLLNHITESIGKRLINTTEIQIISSFLEDITFNYDQAVVLDNLIDGIDIECPEGNKLIESFNSKPESHD